jgi:hypothetical protein
LAALAAKLAIVDSIFLQRATQTYQDDDPIRNVTIKVPTSSNFPLSSIVANSQGVDIRGGFQGYVVDTWRGTGFTTLANFEGCKGYREGILPTVGFSYTCDTPKTEQINLSEPKYQNGSSMSLFDLSFKMSWASGTKDYSSILFDFEYFTADSPTGDCTGALTSYHCEARPAALDILFLLADFSKTDTKLPVDSSVRIGHGLQTTARHHHRLDGWKVE